MFQNSEVCCHQDICRADKINAFSHIALGIIGPTNTPEEIVIDGLQISPQGFAAPVAGGCTSCTVDSGDIEKVPKGQRESEINCCHTAAENLVVVPQNKTWLPGL